VWSAGDGVGFVVECVQIAAVVGPIAAGVDVVVEAEAAAGGGGEGGFFALAADFAGADDFGGYVRFGKLNGGAEGDSHFGEDEVGAAIEELLGGGVVFGVEEFEDGDSLAGPISKNSRRVGKKCQAHSLGGA
jgi:hypothetical protein